MQEALRLFGTRGYADVGVGELAEQAGVTTGSLYHHFGGKPGLYAMVRTDVERRLLDRLEGAAAAAPADLARALLVGFDYLVDGGFARMLSEARPGGDPDPVEEFLARELAGDGVPVARVLAASWRAALGLVEEHPGTAREALARVVPQSTVVPATRRGDA